MVTALSSSFDLGRESGLLISALAFSWSVLEVASERVMTIIFVKLVGLVQF